MHLLRQSLFSRALTCSIHMYDMVNVKHVVSVSYVCQFERKSHIIIHVTFKFFQQCYIIIHKKNTRLHSSLVLDDIQLNSDNFKHP